MLLKIIKKSHKKMAFSLYGILGILTVILPLIIIGIGIYFAVSKINNYGLIWILVGAFAFLIGLRKIKDIIGIYKYIFKPQNFPTYKALVESGVDPAIFDEELEDAHVLETLSKNNPLMITENFIIGLSPVSFFVFKKEDVVWVYEYNGNGLVLYDNHRIYGYTSYPTVDGNDIALEQIKKEIPYIYFGTDFDYKTIMHDDFDNTVIMLKEERSKFLMDKEGYIEAKLEEERRRLEEESLKLEKEKNDQLQKLESQEAIDFENSEFKEEGVTKVSVCSKCGKEVTNKDPFCSNCGTNNDIYEE